MSDLLAFTTTELVSVMTTEGPRDVVGHRCGAFAATPHLHGAEPDPPDPDDEAAMCRLGDEGPLHGRAA